MSTMKRFFKLKGGGLHLIRKLKHGIERPKLSLINKSCFIKHFDVLEIRNCFMIDRYQQYFKRINQLVCFTLYV